MTKICTKDGDKEDFKTDKAYHSVFYPARETGYTEEDADALAEAVVADLEDWMDDHEDDVLTTKEIRSKVLELLEDRDEDVAFMYETHLDLS